MVRKLKFADGGMPSEYLDEPAESGDSASAQPEKKQSFKEAFASARRGGEKTFTWNGKKFTTELAKPKSTNTGDEAGRQTRIARDKAKESPRISYNNAVSNKLLDSKTLLPTRYAKGGVVMKPESKAMEKKELAFMQKKGAPKSMINEHKKMALSGKDPVKKYASGGMVRGCGAATKGKGFKGMK